MTPEERQMITGLFDRMRSYGTPQKDREAEAVINEGVRSTPDAGYMLVQSVLVQEHALKEAGNRIEDLEEQVRNLRNAGQERTPESGSFLGGLFGGGRPASQPGPGSVPVIGSRAPAPSAGVLRTKSEDVVERVKALVEERRQLERQLGDAKRQLALGGGLSANGAAAAELAIRAVGDIKLLARTVQGLNPKDLRGLVDDGKKQVGSGVVAIVGVTEDGKAGLAVGVTEDLVKRISAVDLVKAGAEALGGKGGGGRPDMAQAGGPDGSKADAALKAIEARLAN